MEFITVKKGSVIFREGDKEKWMFDLCWGTVDIYANYNKPDQQKLTTVKAGDFFGEMGMIEDKARSATAVAAEECQLAKITEDNFNDYFGKRPAKVLMILQQTSRRIRSLSRDYVDACNVLSAYLDAEEKGEEKPAEVMKAMKKIVAAGKKK